MKLALKTHTASKSPLALAQELAKELALNGGMPDHKDRQLQLAKRLVNALTRTA